MSKKPKNRGTIVLSRLLLVGVLAILSPFLLPSIAFLLISLIPTWVALLVDRAKIRYKWLCVGALNVAGAMPFLFSMWFENDSFDEVIRLLTDIRNLSIIYGAAFIGYLIHLVIPPAVASYVQMSNQKRLVSLKEALQGLIFKWGEDVMITEEEQPKKQKTVNK